MISKSKIISINISNHIDISTIMIDTWRTLCKARITCLGGSNDSPFIFNEIGKIKIIILKKTCNDEMNDMPNFHIRNAP